MDNKRIEWVDVCKGIGIILVLLGHAPVSPTFANYIFSFHMPLFFFLSGYLLNVDKYNNYFSFIKARFKRLIVPYIIFSIISVILVCLINDLQLGKLDVMNFLKTSIISKRNGIDYNGALWFFTSLFSIEVMYFPMRKKIKNNSILSLIIFTIGFIGYMYIEIWKYSMLPWSFNYSVLYIVFYSLGNLFRTYKSMIGAKWLVIPLIILNITYLLSNNIISRLIGLSNRFVIAGYLFTIIISLDGIITCIVIAKYLEAFGILKDIGQNSMIVFALHLPLCYTLINRFLGVLNIKVLPINIIGFAYTLAALLMLMPIVRYINNKHAYSSQSI